MDWLIQLDKDLFLILNGWHSDFFDQVMVFISGKYGWIWLYALLLFLAWKKSKHKEFWFLLAAIVVMIVIADMGSVHLFKNQFQRFRPSHNPEFEGIIHLVNGYKGGSFGFISSHAANTAAVAIFFSLFFNNRLITMGLMIFTVLVSYSRIYLGVHYPADVLVGMFWGFLSGFIAYQLFSLARKKTSGF